MYARSSATATFTSTVLPSMMNRAGASIRIALGEERMYLATLIESAVPTDSHGAHAVSTRTRSLLLLRAALFLSLLCNTPALAGGAAFEQFFGIYEGTSDTIPGGEKQARKLSVTIGPYKKNGFTIDWKTTQYKATGRVKHSGLSVNFIPTHRSNIFASAMRTDLFGHQVPLDAMKGDPFVWITIRDETLTLYVIRIADSGEQDLQIDKLTRTPQGLHDEFISFYGSEPVRRLTATLKKTGG